MVGSTSRATRSSLDQKMPRKYAMWKRAMGMTQEIAAGSGLLVSEYYAAVLLPSFTGEIGAFSRGGLVLAGCVIWPQVVR